MSAGLFGISYPAAITEKLDTKSLALPAFPLGYNLAGAVTQKALPRWGRWRVAPDEVPIKPL